MDGTGGKEGKKEEGSFFCRKGDLKVNIGCQTPSIRFVPFVEVGGEMYCTILQKEWRGRSRLIHDSSPSRGVSD